MPIELALGLRPALPALGASLPPELTGQLGAFGPLPIRLPLACFGSQPRRRLEPIVEVKGIINQFVSNFDELVRALDAQLTTSGKDPKRRF